MYHDRYSQASSFGMFYHKARARRATARADRARPPLLRDGIVRGAGASTSPKTRSTRSSPPNKFSQVCDVEGRVRRSTEAPVVFSSSARQGSRVSAGVSDCTAVKMCALLAHHQLHYQRSSPWKLVGASCQCPLKTSAGALMLGGGQRSAGTGGVGIGSARPVMRRRPCSAKRRFVDGQLLIEGSFRTIPTFSRLSSKPCLLGRASSAVARPSSSPRDFGITRFDLWPPAATVRS